MPARSVRVPFSPEIVLIILCFIGLFCVHGQRMHELLWVDEIHTRANLSFGWIQLIQDRYREGHSPLYFALIKLWALLVSAIKGVAPSELSAGMVRMPSMMAVGVAGGLLAAAAWRSWAPACGLLFVPLWVFSPMVGRQFVEARPWPLLLLALSVGIWSSSRLWSESGSARRADEETRNAYLLWILSTAAPVLAAVTVPVGILAVLTSEVTAITLLGQSKDALFAKRWKRRTAFVLVSVAVVSAVMAPAIRHKATDYWVDKVRPFSFEAIQDVVSGVVLPNTSSTGMILLLLMTFGFYFRRNDFIGRASGGLAIVFPLVLIGISTVKSLLISRYFLPVIPGLFLLAVGMVSNRFNLRTLLCVASVPLVTLALWEAPSLSRGQTRQAEQQLAVLKRIQVDEIEGVATHQHLAEILDHYIPRRFGIQANVSYAREPLKVDELPDDDILWVFGHKRGAARRLVEGLNVVCYFGLKSGEIYVVARSAVKAPFDKAACDEQP